jgi:hypothetical protein
MIKSAQGEILRSKGTGDLEGGKNKDTFSFFTFLEENNATVLLVLMTQLLMSYSEPDFL